MNDNSNYQALVPVIERLELSRQALEDESDMFNKLTLFDWKIDEDHVIWITFIRTEFTQLDKRVDYGVILSKQCDKSKNKNGIVYSDGIRRLSIYFGSKYAALIIEDDVREDTWHEASDHLTLTRERADALITCIDEVCKKPHAQI